jgi:hypothetical protein
MARTGRALSDSNFELVFNVQLNPFVEVPLAEKAMRIIDATNRDLVDQDLG